MFDLISKADDYSKVAKLAHQVWAESQPLRADIVMRAYDALKIFPTKRVEEILDNNWDVSYYPGNSQMNFELSLPWIGKFDFEEYIEYATEIVNEEAVYTLDIKEKIVKELDGKDFYCFFTAFRHVYFKIPEDYMETLEALGKVHVEESVSRAIYCGV